MVRVSVLPRNVKTYPTGSLTPTTRLRHLPPSGGQQVAEESAADSLLPRYFALRRAPVAAQLVHVPRGSSTTIGDSETRVLQRVVAGRRAAAPAGRRIAVEKRGHNV